MKTTRFDRIVIMVRDMEKALEFFSGRLGMEFMELEKDISERDGVRSYVCHDTHVHLITPILPLPPDAAPPMRKRVDLLKENEYVFMALTFMTDDVQQAEAELIQQGIHIQHRYDKSHDYASIGMDNFTEIVTSAEGSLGIVMGFASYDQPRRADRAPEQKNVMQVTGLDRVVVMVKDMDKAREFFAGKLGMEFREVDEEVQKQAGNRGLVCLDKHIHLVQPNLPLPEGAPPFLRQGAKVIQEQGKDATVLVLLFKMDDPMASMDEMKRQGFVVLGTWEDDRDYASVGMDHLWEFIVDPKDTLGISMGFSKWDRV
jgi:catechol 2,3-dioxygenase-like lactoylglutathione lyase family enzyme